MHWLPVVSGVLSFWKAWQDVSTPPTSVALKLNDEQVKVVNAFLEDLVPPSKTVTVGIVATPVVPISAIPSAYPTATPAAVASYRHYDDTPKSTILFTPLSCHDTIFAIADFLENGGITVPEFKITTLRITKMLFMLGCVHLIYMIIFKDFKLPAKAATSICHAVCSGSKVLWALLFAASMFCGYDTLSEDPLQLATMELIFLDQVSLDFVARFVRAKVMSWRNPLPDHPGGLWLMGELFGNIDHMQQNQQFTPKTLEEVFVGVLVWLYRRACAHYNFMTTPGAALWLWIRPRIKPAGMELLRKLPTIKQVIAVVLTLWKWLQKLIRLRYECIVRPVLRFFVIVGCYLLQYFIRGGFDQSMAGNWDYRCAFGTAATLSLDEIAKLMVGNKTLEQQMANMLPEARKQAGLEAHTEMLGKRGRS